MSEGLLRVEHLEVRYRTAGADLPVLRDVSLHIDVGEIVGVVGESGCGKSTLSSAILRLLPPNGAIAGGAIHLGERELTSLPAEEMRRLRGPEIAMVFQDPLSSLNPVFTVWAQIRDAVRAHTSRGAFDARVLRTRTAATLNELGIPDAERRLDDYPHQFSGGMRQRIVIAMALLLEPRLLIADEPTSALDATMQAQIVSILARLRRERDMAIMFVTHDLALVSHLCDRVVVMYAGLIVEEGPVARVFRDPVHPYTRALLASIPSRHEHVERLATIPGSVPSLSDLPAGCPFADRCSAVRATCRSSVPAVREQDGRLVRCFAGDPSSPYASEPSELAVGIAP